MDPQATYDAWLEADGDPQERRQLREAYNAWRDRGGFPAVDESGAQVLRLEPDEAEGQDPARGTCATHGALYCLSADCRMIERAGALGRLFERSAGPRAQRQADIWRTQAHVGMTGAAEGGYTVTGRAPGVATVTMRDGTTRDLFAPVPLA